MQAVRQQTKGCALNFEWLALAIQQQTNGCWLHALNFELSGELTKVEQELHFFPPPNTVPLLTAADFQVPNYLFSWLYMTPFTAVFRQRWNWGVACDFKYLFYNL